MLPQDSEGNVFSIHRAAVCSLQMYIYIYRADWESCLVSRANEDSFSHLPDLRKQRIGPGLDAGTPGHECLFVRFLLLLPCQSMFPIALNPRSWKHGSWIYVLFETRISSQLTRLKALKKVSSKHKSQGKDRKGARNSKYRIHSQQGE